MEKLPSLVMSAPRPEVAEPEAAGSGPEAAAPEVWGRCPDDVLLLVLQYSDLQTIVQCYSVNRRWRNIVDYWAQHNNKWHILASEMMPNKGATFIRKSLLGWRDLYNNYKLWHQVEKARLKYDCELTFSTGIQYLHVIKDLLTVVHNGETHKAKMTMFRIKDSGFLPATKTKEPYSDPDGQVLRIPGMTFVQAIINSGPYKRIAFPAIPAELTNSHCFYALNADNKIEFLFWGRAPMLCDDLVGAYYGSDESLDDFHLVEWKDNQIILYMKQATLNIVHCSGTGILRNRPYYRPHPMMHSEKIFRPPVLAVFPNLSKEIAEDCKTVYNSGKLFVGLSLDTTEVIPFYPVQPNVSVREETSRPRASPFLPFSRPKYEYGQSPDIDPEDGSEDRLKISPFISRCIHWVGSDKNLTSATQHGDMLFLGYLDGKVEIHKINFKVVADKSPARFMFNIKNYVAQEKDYKVIVIEVYEMKNSHCLLIATAQKVHRFVLAYP